MAQTITGDQPETTRTRRPAWMNVLVAHHAGLRLYQWLWIVLCVVSGLIVVAPRVLSQPVIYQTTAETHFDVSRYAGLYQNGELGTDFHIAINDATEALRQQNLARREVRFGLPDYRVTYMPQQPGVVAVQGTGTTAEEAYQLANAGAEELVRQIQAAGGREILRNLLGWELVVALREEPVISPFEYHLRAIIESGAFPMSRPIAPVSARISVEQLTAAEQNDLTRALEARYDLWSVEINTRNATLDHLCGTASLLDTTARETALQRCAIALGEAGAEPVADEDNPVLRELHERNRAIARRQAIHGALRFMLDRQGATFHPEDTTGVAYRTTAPLPSGPVPRRVGLLLALTAGLGLVFGVVSVAIDRSAGGMYKLRELWRYHELIRDLVVRDLRVRYKGSVLGYLWTQLAPLLMMLVFTFVFTLLMNSGIALFPVFIIVGLLPWNYCSEVITSGTRSVLDNANLIKKVFFPREILPLVSVLSGLLNYLFSLPMMFLVMAATQFVVLGRLNFSWTFLYLPVLLLLQTLFLTGLTFFISALAVFFRDVVHLVGILILFWFFLTPVFYSLDTVRMPMMARMLRWVNPMASIIEFYREILYGNTVAVGLVPTPGLPALDSVLRLVVTVLLVLGFGYWFFQRQSAQFGELL